jgi:NitT/TauT family transport system ATP-binding protein
MRARIWSVAAMDSTAAVPPAERQDTSTARTAISVRSLSKTYRTRTGVVPAVRDASFGVSESEFVSLVGPSGCGKSTILKIVAGLIPFERGSVEVSGSPAKAGRSDVGIMLQAPVLLPWRTVLKNVLLPIEIFKANSGEARRRAQELISMVGLEGFEDKYPWELSGGMQQRASLARLLVFEPDTLLLDEPFSALDEFTREKLTLELARLHTNLQRTVLYVTHNIAEAVFLSDRVVVMKSHPGQIVDIVEVNLPHPRSLNMLDDPRTTALVGGIRRLFQHELEENIK